jgi:hypothetical protein
MQAQNLYIEIGKHREEEREDNNNNNKTQNLSCNITL